jgi:hypothetical protein
MANKVIVSEQFKLNLRDWLKTALLTVGAPMLYEIQKIIQTAIDSGNFEVHINWKQVAMIGISAGLTYLAKQFFGSPKVTTVYQSNTKAKVVANKIGSAVENN